MKKEAKHIQGGVFPSSPQLCKNKSQQCSVIYIVFQTSECLREQDLSASSSGFLTSLLTKHKPPRISDLCYVPLLLSNQAAYTSALPLRLKVVEKLIASLSPIRSTLIKKATAVGLIKTVWKFWPSFRKAETAISLSGVQDVP